MPDIGTGIAAGSLILGADAAGDAADAQNDAAGLQAEIARQQLAFAREQWDYYKQHYQPLEQEILGIAREAGSPEEQEAAAGRAVADVRQQYGISRDSYRRGLERYGLNPADPTYASMMLDTNLGEAAASAGAANMARDNERNSGYTKMIQALSLGKGLPTDASANMARAGASAGGAAATYGGIYRQDLANTYNMTSALAQMPWNKLFPSQPDVIGNRAATGQLGPPGTDASGSGVVDDVVYLKKGGLVRGPGTGTSDSVPAMLSNKEFVIPAAVVRYKGVGFFEDLIDEVENKSQRRTRRGRHGS